MHPSVRRRTSEAKGDGMSDKLSFESGEESKEAVPGTDAFTKVLVAATIFVMAVVGLVCLFGGE